MPLAEIGPKLYVATMITVLFNSYAYLVETMNHIKSLKLKDRPGENVTNFCDGILVDPEQF